MTTSLESRLIKKVPFVLKDVDPTASDVYYDVPTLWLNRETDTHFLLTDITGEVATWFEFSNAGNDYIHPNHTGAVTSTGDGVTVITDKAVTLSKMADMTTASLLGRNTAGTGVPEVLSKTTVLSLLNVDDGADVTNANSQSVSWLNESVGSVLPEANTEADVNTIDAGDGLAALDSGANTKLTGIAIGADVTGDNTAADVTGQGDLATQDRNDLDYTDGADVTNYENPQISNNINEDGVTTISRPGGASYSGDNINTGAIVITLPQSWTNTMMKLAVSVFNYSTNKSFSLDLAGYTYNGDSSWYNTTANLMGSIASDNRVRFGHDGTNCCIVIGETTSNWIYSNISVRDFQAGRQDRAIDSWDDGWVINVLDDLTGYTFTRDHSDALIDANAIRDQGDLAIQDRNDLDYDDGADVTNANSQSVSWLNESVGSVLPEANTEADINTIDAGDGLAALDSGANTKLGGVANNADVTPGLPSDEHLVGYWNFDEGTGTTAHDRSANSNDGTLFNMEDADWVSGVVGTGLEFDGANEYVSKVSNADLEPIENISVSVWVKFAGTATINTIIANTQTGSNGYLLFWYANKLHFTVDAYNSNFASFTFPASPLNTDWHHIVGTYSKTDGKVKIYVDGVKGTEAAYSSDMVYASNLFTIGRMGSYGSEYYFEGLIDEARIYDTALTANEVRALYLYPAGNKAPADVTGDNTAASIVNQGNLATQDENDITSMTALATLSHKLALSNNLTLGSGDAGTNATKTLTLEVGTVPSSSPSDAVQLYSEGTDAELKVRDELGNITVLSPHAFELFEPNKDIEFPWSYHSENHFIGKKINVDMAGLVKAVEKLTGLKFIYTIDVKKKDWDLEQEKIKVFEDQKRRDYIFSQKPTIEVNEEDATEEIEVLNEVTEEVESEKKIKENFYFNLDTKTYYRFLTREEIIFPEYIKKLMPSWLEKRTFGGIRK